MEAKIQELQKELELVKRERDAAKSLCEMVQRHYMELLQKTMSFSAVQPTPQVFPLVEPLPGTAPADASSARTSVKRPAGAYPHPAKRVTSTVTCASAMASSSPEEASAIASGRPDGPRAASSPDASRPLSLHGQYDALILSDSVMKAIDTDFLEIRKARLYAVSGLTIKEAARVLEEMGRQGTRTRSLIVCVGTNDYCVTSLASIKKSLDEVVAAASCIASRTYLCNLYESHWKGRRFPMNMYETHNRTRQSINQYIASTGRSNSSVKVIDLEDVFRGHAGTSQDTGRGWYHNDAVHPNAAGAGAIEVVLKQVLSGREVAAPNHNDSAVQYDDTTISWRRKVSDDNYAVSGPLKKWLNRPTHSSGRRRR